MWADAQRDSRPAEYQWRPLFNAAKFGWRIMALFCVISANSGSFRAHCVKVHVRYVISWSVLVSCWWWTV